MGQAFQIDPVVFETAPREASAVESVASLPLAVSAVQPTRLPAQPLPAWYLTPAAMVPIAAAAFIIGNVLLMIPWQAL